MLSSPYTPQSNVYSMVARVLAMLCPVCAVATSNLARAYELTERVSNCVSHTTGRT